MATELGQVAKRLLQTAKRITDEQGGFSRTHLGVTDEAHLNLKKAWGELTGQGLVANKMGAPADRPLMITEAGRTALQLVQA